jgi:hypothetical protein
MGFTSAFYRAGRMYGAGLTSLDELVCPMFRQKRGAFALQLNQEMKSISITGMPPPEHD